MGLCNRFVLEISFIMDDIVCEMYFTIPYPYILYLIHIYSWIVYFTT